MGNKIVEPQNYILYNNYVAFDDPAEANTGRLSQPGKVLKANFFMGPCKASGIKINVEIPSLSQTQQTDIRTHTLPVSSDNEKLLRFYSPLNQMLFASWGKRLNRYKNPC